MDTITTFKIYTEEQLKCNKQWCGHNSMTWRPLSNRENLNISRVSDFMKNKTKIIKKHDDLHDDCVELMEQVVRIFLGQQLHEISKVEKKLSCIQNKTFRNESNYITLHFKEPVCLFLHVRPCNYINILAATSVFQNIQIRFHELMNIYSNDVCKRNQRKTVF